MSIFLDSSDANLVFRFHDMGVIRGVTTNPTILRKEGVRSEDIEKRIKNIAFQVAPYPVSVEVTSNDPIEMRRQAVGMAGWAANIVIKVPIHGPLGESNLGVIHALETSDHIPVNVTACMSAQQCLLAAMAGASFVSLFCGRIANMGHDPCAELSLLRRLLLNCDLGSKVIAASVRECRNVVEWLDAGSDIVTVTPDLLEKMAVHPYTKETVAMFLADATGS